MIHVTGWPLGSSEAVAGGGGGAGIWGLLLKLSPGSGEVVEWQGAIIGVRGAGDS